MHQTSETNSSPLIRVLLADDHAVVLEGLSAIIGRQPDMRVVAHAANGREAVEFWKKYHPDVTLLDLRMPELDGLGALRELRQIDVNARVIVLTTYDTDEHIYQAIKAGAKAYLLKDARREELLECIRKVHTGETCVSAELTAKLASRIGGDALSSRELGVLRLLAQGRSNREIAGALFIGETTVKSHVKNLFAKLNVLSRTEAVAAAVQRGLIEL